MGRGGDVLWLTRMRLATYGARACVRERGREGAKLVYLSIEAAGCLPLGIAPTHVSE